MLRNRLRRAPRTPSSPPRLPPAFLSTTAAPAPPRRAPPRPHNHCRLAARGRTHPTVVVTSTAGTACRGHRVRPITGGSVVAHRGPHSHPPAVILLLHRDPTARSRCAVLRSPCCQVLLKAHVESVCFKCFRCFGGMLHLF
jgi:hypothetical protein